MTKPPISCRKCQCADVDVLLWCSTYLSFQTVQYRHRRFRARCGHKKDRFLIRHLYCRSVATNIHNSPGSLRALLRGVHVVRGHESSPSLPGHGEGTTVSCAEQSARLRAYADGAIRRNVVWDQQSRAMMESCPWIRTSFSFHEVAVVFLSNTCPSVGLAPHRIPVHRTI